MNQAKEKINLSKNPQNYIDSLSLILQFAIAAIVGSMWFNMVILIINAIKLIGILNIKDVIELCCTDFKDYGCSYNLFQNVVIVNMGK